MSKRADLMNHAETLTRTRGFDGFSFGDLAELAGIRKASVHYHFPVKGDLSLALIGRYRAAFVERLNKISGQEIRGGARLLAFLNLYRDASDHGRSLCLCVALSVTQSALPRETTTELSMFHHDVAAWLEVALCLGQLDGSVAGVVDPRTEAQGVLAQVEGAQIMARAARDPARFEAAIAPLLARAL